MLRLAGPCLRKKSAYACPSRLQAALPLIPSRRRESRPKVLHEPADRITKRE
jgi:hypothetical protein